MKKDSKHVQAFLLVMVIAIWGIIGYRVYLAMNAEAPMVAIEPVINNRVVVETEASSTALFLNYPDPFTGKQQRKKSTVPRNEQKKLTPNRPELVNPPNIEYRGYTVNQQGVIRVSLIVDGQQIYLSPYEQKEDLQLINVSRSKISVQFKTKIIEVARN